MGRPKFDFVHSWCGSLASAGDLFDTLVTRARICYAPQPAQKKCVCAVAWTLLLLSESKLCVFLRWLCALASFSLFSRWLSLWFRSLAHFSSYTNCMCVIFNSPNNLSYNTKRFLTYTALSVWLCACARHWCACALCTRDIIVAVCGWGAYTAHSHSDANASKRQ